MTFEQHTGRRDPKRILLLGANSMVGWSILRYAGFSEITAIGSTPRSTVPGWIHEGIDFREQAQVVSLFKRHRPSIVLHAAGMCKVAKCEAHPDFADEINVRATKRILQCMPKDARLVYLSSDHVFGGQTGPCHEFTKRMPISEYGRNRCKAEDLVLERTQNLVIRSGLWIGPSAKGRMGHLDWLRYRHRRKLRITIVADEERSALWSTDAAKRVFDLVSSNVCGVRHIVAERIIDRPNLARHLIDLLGDPIRFHTEERSEQPAPHLGRVELRSKLDDELSKPIQGVYLSAFPNEFHESHASSI